jgi:hypothetical protein
MKSRYRFALNLAWAYGLLVAPAYAANPFSITVNYTGDAAYKSYFTNAAAYWERRIPSYIDGHQSPPGFVGTADFPGITISASTAIGDGIGGNLASARPTAGGYDNTGFFMAVTGDMIFDKDDAAVMGSNLETVILHEMAHVIGIGTLWKYNGLYDGTNAPGEYTGAAGLAGYNAEFGESSATWVPVEQGGGSGTANAHWNENETFLNPGYSVANTGLTSNISGLDMRYELMTGFYEPGSYFISSVTRGSLRDLGYNTQTTWTSSTGTGDAVWSAPANWGGSLPAEFEFATFPQAVPTNNREVTLGGTSVTINTLQLDNDWNVVIKNGTLNTSNINSTGTGTTTLKGISVIGNPNLTLGSSSILKFLDADGTASAAATVTNVSGGGEIEGDITIKGTHAPGGSGTVGTQAFTNSSGTSSNLTYANGSIFEWDLGKSSVVDVDGTQFDRVSVTGNIAVGADTIFRVVLGGAALSDILNPANAFWNTPYGTQSWSMSSIFGEAFSSGWFSSVQVANYVSSYGSFSITQTNLVWNAVPEMTTLGSGLLLLLGTFRRRRGA